VHWVPGRQRVTDRLLQQNLAAAAQLHMHMHLQTLQKVQHRPQVWLQQRQHNPTAAATAAQLQNNQAAALL
jgi:hypothetical protein